jgi:flagellar hook-length control protein FliK
MRLPGLGFLTNEAMPKESSAEPARDPAQAFDAVMSRLSNGRAQHPAPDAQNGAGRASGKQPAQKGQGEHACAQPVARTKPEDTDATSGAPAADPALADPAAVVAAVADSTQLVAQNPMVAPVVTTPVAQPVVEATTTDDDVDTTATALDVLAGQAKTVTGRSGEKAPADPQVTNESDDDVAPVNTGATPNRRTPMAAKDTLRIDAPLARALDAARNEIATRFSGALPAAMQATRQGPSIPAGETTSQMIAAAVAGNGGSTATYSIAHAAVSTPVGSAGFANELAQRVVVFAGQRVQRADISVTPADLGPVAVSIEVRGHEATLAFSAASHTTRAAIEDALPRLREMLSAQGLQLTGTHVGSEPRRDPYRPTPEKAGVREPGRAGISPVSDAPTTPIRRAVNLIDIEV